MLEVAWNGTCSSSFHVLNGVRQSSVNSLQCWKSCLMPTNLSDCLCCYPNGTTEPATQAACLCIPSYMIGTQLIEYVDKWPHLNHIITNDCIDTDDILAKKFSVIEQINKVLYSLSKDKCQTKTRLVKAYCTSFHGAELWDLSQTNIESIRTAWRKGIRRIWHLPKIPHIQLSYQT